MSTQLLTIDGAYKRYLTKNVDERGWLMECYKHGALSRPQPVYTYVSKNYPGVVRAWHYHKEQEDYWVVVSGNIKAVLYDARRDSSTYGTVEEVYMGDDNPLELVIPIGVYHGYKTIGNTPSLLINSPTMIYDPNNLDEYRVDWKTNGIPYDWDIVIT